MMDYLKSKTNRDLDYNHAIRIDESIWWVGHYLPGDPFQCHVYLIDAGDQSVLIDPGSQLTFAKTMEKIEEIIPFDSIKYFIVHHQDPDITGALLLIDSMVNRKDAVILSHWRTNALLKHYDLKLPLKCVEEMDWELPLPGRTLRFIFTPICILPERLQPMMRKVKPCFQAIFTADLQQDGLLLLRAKNILIQCGCFMSIICLQGRSCGIQ